MSLIEKAKEFVARGTWEDLERLLQDCVTTGTVEALAAVQILAEDMYGGLTYNSELKRCAATCLVRWKGAGVRALGEIAQRTPTLKNYSIALAMLSRLAAGGKLKGTWVGASLMELVEARVGDWDEVAEAARVELNALALSIASDDDAAFWAACAIQELAVIDGAKEVKALFLAMAARWLAVGPRTLLAYEELLGSNPDEETQFHAFFESHPELLDPMTLEVWSKPDLHGAAEPDFVIRRIDGTYVVVEIETPGKALVTSGLQVSARTTQAVAQALGYRAFLVERWAEAAARFPGFQTPECLVVIGMERDLSVEQRHVLRRENEGRGGLRIVGFDWLAERARVLGRNVVEGSMDVRRVRMT